MRIVQVTPRYPPHTGGVENQVKEISERLADRGHDVRVVSADASPDVRSREERNGVSVRRHRSFAPGDAYHVGPGVVASIWSDDADVVHAHNYHSLPMLFASIGAGNSRLVVTPHYHGGSSDPIRDRLLEVYRVVGTWALRRADEVIAVSEWERRRLRDDFGVEASVIPNGLDSKRFETAAPERRARPYLLTVGRLEEYKGVQYAIRALPELDDLELVVAGTGPYRLELEREASRVDVADRVTFLGYVDDSRLPGLYAGAETFLALSSFEAYGMTVAEALAAGTPCVVREAGALVEWADRDGCVGLDSITPTKIATGVRAARDLSAPTGSIPSWNDVVMELMEIYE